MTTPTEYREAVASEVRAAMARKRTTQAALAARIGISRTALGDRLACRRAFDMDQIIGICETLNLDPSKLLIVATHAEAAA